MSYLIRIITLSLFVAAPSICLGENDYPVLEFPILGSEFIGENCSLETNQVIAKLELSREGEILRFEFVKRSTIPEINDEAERDIMATAPIWEYEDIADQEAENHRFVFMYYTIPCKTGCASNGTNDIDLTEYLPQGDYIFEGFLFTAGYTSFVPRSKIAFAFYPDQMHVVFLGLEDFEECAEPRPEDILEISLETCPVLANRYESLQLTVREMASLATETGPTSLPEIQVMDGPVYRLEYGSPRIASSITLYGGGTARYHVGWVNEALDAIDVALACGDYQ